MPLPANAVPLTAWADRTRSISAFVEQIHAITAVEVKKLARDPTEVLTRSVQPALWLLVFGQVFTRTRAIPTGSLSYSERFFDEDGAVTYLL